MWGRGGAKVSDFFLLRIQIKNEKKMFCFFWLEWGGRGGGGGWSK